MPEPKLFETDRPRSTLLLPSSKTPWVKSLIEPPLTVMPVWPAVLSMPRSQNRASGGIGEHAVTVDGVAIEVKGDVVGSDNKPIGGAVDEVAVERGVRRDRSPHVSASPPNEAHS